MSTEAFLVAYVVLIITVVVGELLILSNNKGQYIRTSYASLKSICENLKNENIQQMENHLSNEINRFYNEYVQESPQIKKFFPNVVIWIDAIIFRIDCGYKHASVLKEYANTLKKARDVLETENPFNKCEKYQQGILCDIRKMQNHENEIVVQNILSRTEEEFLRLSGDIRKNNRLNVVSIAIGVIGIIVSILMAVMKF